MQGNRNGVGFVVRVGLMEEVEWVNDRIMKMTIAGKDDKLELIQVYAPQVGCSEDEKEKFREELERWIGREGQIVMGDLNAQMGSDRMGLEDVLAPEGRGGRNEEGQRLLEICVRNGMMIGNSCLRIEETVTK